MFGHLRAVGWRAKLVWAPVSWGVEWGWCSSTPELVSSAEWAGRWGGCAGACLMATTGSVAARSPCGGVFHGDTFGRSCPEGVRALSHTAEAVSALWRPQNRGSLRESCPGSFRFHSSLPRHPQARTDWLRGDGGSDDPTFLLPPRGSSPVTRQSHLLPCRHHVTLKRVGASGGPPPPCERYTVSTACAHL